MRIANTTTPAVILSCPHHGGLGVTRSLGRLGVPVFNVDANRWAPALFSRYCAGKSHWDVDQAPPEKSVDELIRLARRVGQRCMLISTTDTATIFVADHAEVLKEWFIFPAQSGAMVQSLCNKKQMHDFARKSNVPTPETFWPQTRADLIECLRWLQFPLMIKAVDGQLRKRGHKTKWIIRSRQDLFVLYDWLGDKSTGNLIVQEFIPGAEDTVWMFNGYFNQHSECLVSFTGRKLRQCPVYTGVTSLGICQKNDAVEETAKRLMKAAGYQGIVDMDFRYDARDGEYKLLDVNPRIGSTFRLFVSEDGMDVARALYLDLTRQPVPPARLHEGRKWMVEDFDLTASFRYCRDGLLTLREWVRSLRGVQESAFFCVDDLVPVLMMLRADLSEFFRLIKPRWDPMLPFGNKHRATL